MSWRTRTARSASTCRRCWSRLPRPRRPVEREDRNITLRHDQAQAISDSHWNYYQAKHEKQNLADRRSTKLSALPGSAEVSKRRQLQENKWRATTEKRREGEAEGYEKKYKAAQRAARLFDLWSGAVGRIALPAFTARRGKWRCCTACASGARRVFRRGRIHETCHRPDISRRG